MAFNLGAFAGGLAKGGMDTYTTLKAIEDREQERALREKEFALRNEAASRDREKYETEKAVQTAVASGQSQVGTGFGNEQARMLAEQSGGGEFGSAAQNAAINVGQENVARAKTAGGLPTNFSTMTQEQADAATLARVRGIDYKAAQAMEEGGLRIAGAKQTLKTGEYQLKELQRNQEVNEKFDNVMKTWQKENAFKLRQDFDTTLVDEGASGILKKYGPEFKKATGNDVALVGGQIQISRDGKVIDRFPSEQLQAKMEPLLAQKSMDGLMKTMVDQGLFKNTAEVLNFFKIQSEMKNQGVSADAAMISAMAKAATVSSENRKNNAYAGYLESGGAGGRPKTQIVQVDGGKDANGQAIGKTPISVTTTIGDDGVPVIKAFTLDGKPITDKAMLNKAFSAAAGGGETTAPVTDSKFAALRKSVLENKDLTVEEKQKQLDEIDILEKMPKRGEKLNPNADKGNKPDAVKSDADKPDLKKAEPRFAREKTNRGNYVYSPSPRGMTRAEWAELDQRQTAIPQ